MNSSDFATAPSLSSQGSADPAASCTNTPHSPPVVQPRTSIPASTGSPSGSHVGIHAVQSPSSHHAQQIQALSSMLRAKTEAPRATQQQVKYSLIRHCCAEHCTCIYMYMHVLFDDHYWKRVRPGHVTCGQGVQPNSLSVTFDPAHNKAKIGRVWYIPFPFLPRSPSLGSRPSPYNYVRVLIARGWANRRAGKAWVDSSREGRTVVVQYLARAPWCRCGTLFSRYQAFLTRCFWRTVEAKSKTIGCWVRRRPLLSF